MVIFGEGSRFSIVWLSGNHVLGGPLHRAGGITSTVHIRRSPQAGHLARSIPAIRNRASCQVSSFFSAFSFFSPHARSSLARPICYPVTWVGRIKLLFLKQYHFKSWRFQGLKALFCDSKAACRPSALGIFSPYSYLLTVKKEHSKAPVT
jgi:hypothetical protein